MDGTRLAMRRAMRVRALIILFAVGLGVQVTGCVANTDSVQEDVELSADALETARANTDGFRDIPDMSEAERQSALDKYESVPHPGVRAALWEKAVLYYDANYDRIVNKDSLAVIDFRKHSGQRRFYIFDMKDRGPMKSYVTAHGKKSDPNDDGVATEFGNVVDSNKSSVGFYVTAETYISARNGESLRLDGLSSTNSNVRERAVVIHPAAYVEDGRAKQGLSLGCPALPQADAPTVIARIKGGTVIYAMN